MRAQPKKMATRRPMLNEIGEPNPSDPNCWGGPDALPLGRPRRILEPIWERMLNDDRYPWFSPEMKQAGDEIERVFVAVSGALMSRSQMGDGGGSSSGGWAESLVIAWRDRYKPWAAAMSAHRIATGSPVFEFILDIALEDLTMRECERRLGVRNGKGPEIIRFGLGEYVTMAGWTRDARRARRSHTRA